MAVSEQRAVIAETGGLQPRPTVGNRILNALIDRANRKRQESVGARATALLASLKLQKGDPLLKSNLTHLSKNSDLFLAELALKPKCLELQLRVIELAAEYALARSAVEEMVGIEPSARLFRALLGQAAHDGADALRFSFPVGDASTFPVLFRVEADWKKAMSIPSGLEAALRGCVKRLELAGIAVLKPYMINGSVQLPDDVEMTWASPCKLEIRLTY